MRRLMILTAVLAALWGGYWFVGSTGLQRGAAGLQSELAARGWQAEWQALRVRGFPSRFDTVLTAPSLTEAPGGFGWQAPDLQIMALSYRPNAVIVAFPPEQELAFGAQRITVTSEAMRASARVAWALSLPVQAVTLEAESLALRSSYGWQATLADGLFAFREAAGAHEYDLYATAAPVTLPAEAMRLADPEGRMPGFLALLRADMTLGFTGPLALNRSEEPRLTTLRLREFRLDWGGLGLAASGDFTADASGYAEGVLTVAISDLALALDLAVASGLILPEQRGLWEGGAGAFDMGDGRIELPITMQGGQMSIGLWPLGPAPRLAPPAGM